MHKKLHSLSKFLFFQLFSTWNAHSVFPDHRFSRHLSPLSPLWARDLRAETSSLRFGGSQTSLVSREMVAIPVCAVQGSLTWCGVGEETFYIRERTGHCSRDTRDNNERSTRVWGEAGGCSPLTWSRSCSSPAPPSPGPGCSTPLQLCSQATVCSAAVLAACNQLGQSPATLRGETLYHLHSQDTRKKIQHMR